MRRRIFGPRGLALALAAGFSLLLGTPVAVAADPATPVATQARHQLYDVATTSASAASVQFAQEPADSIITADLVNDSLGYTATAFDSTAGSEGQASAVYPGTLVTQGPALLCSEGILPFACPVTPPAYPLLADATYPQHRTVTVGATSSALPASSPLSAGAAASTAHATASSASGAAAAGNTSLLSGSSVGVSIGAQRSRSVIATTSRGVKVTVVSHDSDVDIAGILRIGSVTGRVVQRIINGHGVVDRPGVMVTGVTVAGQAASIGPHGLHVAGHDGPSLLRRIAGHGITVDPVKVEHHDTKHGARSAVTGVVITTKAALTKAPYVPNPLASLPPLNQVPGLDVNGTYVTTIQLGAAGAASGLEREADVGLGHLGPLPITPPGPTPSAGHTTAPAAPSATATGTAVRSNGPVAPDSDGTPTIPKARGGAAPTVARSTVALTQTRTVGFPDGWDTNLERLYLAMALGVAGIFIGWRLRVGLRSDSPLRRLPLRSSSWWPSSWRRS